MMGLTNIEKYLAFPQLEKFYALPFEEQLKDILHVRKVSELLFTLVASETALTTGMKKHEHSVELQFESKKLVVVLREAFFEEEYLHLKDNTDVLLVTLVVMVVDAAIEKDIVINYVSISTFKELIEKNVGEYMKGLVERWGGSEIKSINE